MRRWSVTIAPLVWNHIAAQALYIGEHSIDNALAWEARLDAAIFKLADTPRLRRG